MKLLALMLFVACGTEQAQAAPAPIITVDTRQPLKLICTETRVGWMYTPTGYVEFEWCNDWVTSE